MKSHSVKNFFNFAERSDLKAIIKENSTFTYKELFNSASKFSSEFQQYNFKKNTYIPLLVDDSYKFIETVIAIWNLNAVPVPINTRLLDEEIFYLLDNYDFKFLLTDRSSFKKQSNIKIIDLNTSNIAGVNNLKLTIPSTESEAVVIFTSGSTGRPKGVVHTFSSLISNIENGNEVLLQSESDRWLASLPFYHIGGFQIICRSLFYGCSIILPEALKHDHIVNSILNYKPAFLSLVSSQLEKLLNQNIFPDNSFKASLIGGGFIDDELIFAAQEKGWNPIRVYGSSETGSMITAISAEEIKVKPQSVGKPFKKVELRINENSEVLIRSSSLFKKYLSDEAGTDLNLVNGFYNTADCGFVDEDGYLFIEARRSDLIVSGGENVNPLEVEKCLLELDFVEDVCVFPKQDKTWGQIVAAAIVLSNPQYDEKQIKDKLKTKIAGFKIPKVIFFTDSLPRTSLGKLERDKIRKMY